MVVDSPVTQSPSGLVEIRCTSCNRSFRIDAAWTENVSAARCVCGARLALRGEDALTPPGTQRLGKYLLHQRIAVGGMGEIFYGKIAGVEGFEREVAIKKMLPHLSEDRGFIGMMVKEAKLTVLLHHPNIIQVFDLARQGNEYYIAMEYVPGVTVAHLLELSHKSRSMLPYEVVIYMVMQVLRGLAYAHDLRGPTGEPMNVLHRDITPQNIMVTADAWVKIADFGIAKARNEISTTSPGMIKGKLGYIAPEQLSGSQPDQRLDIFCAGILLWEALATKRLFKGADEIDTFRLITECRIPPLSKYRDDVPPEIEEAVRGALTRDPNQRYRTADQFYDALNQAIFPSTADDFASIARRYFAAHQEYFSGVVKRTESLKDAESLDDEVTEEMEVTSTPLDELVEVTDLLHPPKKKSRKGLLFLLAAMAVALLGVVGWAVADRFLTHADTSDSTPTPVFNALTQEEVQLAVNGERQRFLECYNRGDKRFRKIAELSARLVIPSTGGVAEVGLSPPKAELGQVGPCVENLLAGLKFRSHGAPVVTTQVSLPAPLDSVPPPDVKPPTPAPTPASMPAAPPKPLTGNEIQAAVQKKYGAITKCIDDLADVQSAPNNVSATITIGTNGRVSQVTFAPSVGTDSVEQCLRRTLKSLRLRPQPVDDFKVSIPLKITQI
ncbi:MAG: hypothetical protein A2289_20095 [Deltaproteobacteria bacterium RIFOXYA12_FULL_58_15]|nr:MAG: hypothetical protein A2289_20095 [Deltaproteobacteria bacterium RIFOXYA12_FULL_58_15]OGR07152.1 MAG: hypothetical protein A2341_03390 [Deltaproteobacteria bacterium RIFOXYB12_FULL_58_9]